MKPFDPLFNPYYAHLTPTQKKVYEFLYEELKTAPKEINNSISCTHQDVGAAIRAIYYDKPSFYWIKGSAATSSISGSVVSITPTYNSLASDIKGHNAELKKVIDSYLSNVINKNILEQELYIHNRLAQDITYIHSSLDQTAYSALVNKNAVCAGYTRAFQLFMQILNVPCYYCGGDGKANDEDTWDGHAWNILKLGNDFYNMDLTWDDHYKEHNHNSSYISYTYYNCTDAFMAKTHRRDSDTQFLPKCNGTKFSYKEITGIDPEVKRIYQDGVTCKDIAFDKNSYVKILKNELSKNKSKRSFEISFVVKDKKIVDKPWTHFEEAYKNVFGTKGREGMAYTTDYKNGYYLLKFNITIK